MSRKSLRRSAELPLRGKETVFLLSDDPKGFFLEEHKVLSGKGSYPERTQDLLPEDQKIFFKLFSLKNRAILLKKSRKFSLRRAEGFLLEEKKVLS